MAVFKDQPKVVPTLSVVYQWRTLLGYSSVLSRQMAAVSWLFLTIGILLGLTTLTGILANVSVLLVVYWNRSLQTQINMLLVSLAVADLGVAASCVPFAITTVFLQSNVSVFLQFPSVISFLNISNFKK